MAQQVRLVKVFVQPVFMLDDGENLQEVHHEPVTIPADEWPTYSSERFPREVQEWQDKLNAESNGVNTTGGKAHVSR